MTPKHWIKMVVGMVLVFLIGMVGTNVMRAGVRQAESVVQVQPTRISRWTQQIPVADYPFLMDGKPVGQMERLSVTRANGSMVSGMDYTVRLDDSFSVRRFQSCHLVPVTPGAVTEASDWRCIHPQEPGYDALRHFGQITFLPSGEHHLLMVPGEFLDQLQQLDGEDVTTEIRRDGLRLTVNGVTVVDVQGRADGGKVAVHDPVTGAPVVQIEGGTQGGQVKVTTPRP